MRERGPKPSCRVSGGVDAGFTLHKLKHDDFHVITGMTANAPAIQPDSTEAPWWNCTFPVGTRVKTPDGVGKVTGYAVDGDTKNITDFARINGRLYHADILQHAR